MGCRTKRCTRRLTVVHLQTETFTFLFETRKMSVLGPRGKRRGKKKKGVEKGEGRRRRRRKRKRRGGRGGRKGEGGKEG